MSDQSGEVVSRREFEDTMKGVADHLRTLGENDRALGEKVDRLTECLGQLSTLVGHWVETGALPRPPGPAS
ncbi:hypothetical protein [Tautonia rosea]|uniref:hypothetical protein n=1 Tax=Tautonia rosea TaxID=2728037 RepID=UPI001475927E|nr:hypothetical protein [Tautonia rosea]